MTKIDKVTRNFIVVIIMGICSIVVSQCYGHIKSPAGIKVGPYNSTVDNPPIQYDTESKYYKVWIEPSLFRKGHSEIREIPSAGTQKYAR